MSARVLAFSLLLLVLPIAACGSPIPGRAVPEPVAAVEPEVPPARPVSEVPKVQRPLDASKYLADPCASLTSTQQEAFNVTSSRTNSDKTGTSCIWNVGSGSTSPGVTYSTAFTDGLSRLYGLNDIGWWATGYFEPTEVDGYPAVYVSLADLRDEGDCNLVVGINDQLFFESSIRTPPANDACLGAKNVAEAILQTIKEGA
ncbi:DUF3558 domain-containing protein [Amycolatopsis magusensis]|uniref:DUF3558 domain-containing protein n=1 Tax=Amycolatopsis magusensis TaxID=882444 RepID=UPI003C2C939B